jgi:dihydroneopterin aldolase
MTLPFSIHLAIERLQLDLRIGCEEMERREAQPIEVDVCLYMAKIPLGAISDELKDTICYAKCIDIISAAAGKKAFLLIEHLAYEIHSALKKELPMTLEISVKVRKVHPPLPYKMGGVSFTYFPERAPEEKKVTRRWDEE